jgi:hypothetical protein
MAEAIEFTRQYPPIKNLVERSVLVSKKDYLDIPDFQSQLEASPKAEGNIQLPQVGSITLEQLEMRMIAKAMDFYRTGSQKWPRHWASRAARFTDDWRVQYSLR